MDYGINGLNGLTIALEYLKYVVSSSQLFSRDLAILENPLYVYKYLSVYGKSFAIIYGIFRIYCFKLAGCILLNQQPRKPL